MDINYGFGLGESPAQVEALELDGLNIGDFQKDQHLHDQIDTDQSSIYSLVPPFKFHIKSKENAFTQMNRKTYPVQPGQLIEFEAPDTFSSTGYAWEHQVVRISWGKRITFSELADLAYDEYHPPQDHLLGSPGKRVYIFVVKSDAPPG